MLKFKEMKNNIINQKGKNNPSKMEQSTTHNACSPLTFKTIAKEFSPIRKATQPFENVAKFQTDKKQSVSPFRQENYKSDAKENSSKNVYYTKTPNFSDLSFKKLEFAQTKRKCNPKQPSLYTDSQIQRKNSKGTLSFANLLQSKVPSSSSKGKCYLQSERKDDRESSISKLKEKLFGMKRLISDKDDKKSLERPQIKQLQTNRHMNRSPYKLDAYDQDIVKVSIKEDSFPHQLDMTPYLR